MYEDKRLCDQLGQYTPGFREAEDLDNGLVVE